MRRAGAVRGAVVLAIAVTGSAALAPASAQEDRPRFSATDGGHGVGEMHEPGIDGRQVAATTVAVDPSDGPDFEMPFLCGQSWTGTTRSSHSPSYWTIDWNTPNDLGKPALASAPGVVTTSVTLSGSYGRYVVVDHGGGWSTLYAHLNERIASVGQYVDQGELLGYVGGSGNVTGPHLHFEERENRDYFHPYLHRTSFAFSTTPSSANCTDRPLTGDWDGNGRTDIGIHRTTPTANVDYVKTDSSATYFSLGAPGDVPVTGDFNADGKDQVGVKKLGSSTWVLRGGAGNLVTVNGIGAAGDLPLTGDWDGDGRTDLGYYRPSTRTFYQRSLHGTLTAVAFGTSGQVPVTGDWNGDGRTDLGAYVPATRTWSLRVPSGSTYTTRTVVFGAVNDALPITGDWDGDKVTDLGVWRPSSARFYKRTVDNVGSARWLIIGYGRARG